MTGGLPLADEVYTAFARSRARITDMTEIAPGATLLSALMAIRSEPVEAADAVRLDSLWHRFLVWATAQRMIVTHDAVNGGGHLPGLAEHERAQIVSQEIANATNLSYGAAAAQVDPTLTIARSLPQSWMAMDRGELSLLHVKRLARATEDCAPRVAEAVDSIIVPLAVERGWTPKTVGDEAAKLVIRLDPEGAADRAAGKKEDSDLRFYPEPDEMASIHARGDAVTLRQVTDTIEARAIQMGQDGDKRTIGERRISALREFVVGSDLESAVTDTTRLRDPEESGNRAQRRRQRATRRRGEVLVRMDLSTLLGQDDHPAELDGYGPITAQTARFLAKDATWRRLITDPLSGALLDHGHTRYLPTEQLRKFIEIRDKICQFPGCCRPARRCQIDHKVPYPEGPTCLCNLQPLCVMHHQMKTKKWYRIDVDAEGNEVWRTPLGFTFRKRVDQYLMPELEAPSDDHLPPEPSEELLSGDPDPPRADDPLPEAPTITLEEYYQFTDGLEKTAIGAANRFYDDWLSFQRAS